VRRATICCRFFPSGTKPTGAPAVLVLPAPLRFPLRAPAGCELQRVEAQPFPRALGFFLPEERFRPLGVNAASKRRSPSMSKHSEACAAHAARCIEVAAKTSSAEDRREFLSFAAAWEQLATEVEQTERLAAFLDGIGTAEEAAIEANGEPMSSH